MLMQKDLPSDKSSTTTERERITATRARSRSSGCSSSSTVTSRSRTLAEVVESRPCNLAGGIVVVLSGRLEQVERDAGKIGDVFANKDGADDQYKEEYEQGKVQDSVTNDTPLSKARLLDRVDRRSDLTAVQLLACGTMQGSLEITYLGRSQNSMTEWNLSM